MAKQLANIPKEVKYRRAALLNAEIKAAAELAQRSIFEMCSKFKEMRDKELYLELGYQLFSDYCEQEVGVSLRQVERYITIVEKLPSEYAKSTSRVGTEKLYLLATLSDNEREEITTQINIEDTSVRELKRQIKDLREKNIASEQQKIALESKIKELESRPVETVIEQREKIPKNCVTLEAYQKTVSEYNEQLERADGEYIEMKRELSAEIDELKKRIDGGNPEAVFKLCYENAQRALIQLAKFVYENAVFQNKANELLSVYSKLIRDGEK